MRRIANSLIWVVLLLCGQLLAAERVSPRSPSSETSDAAVPLKAVLFAPSRPVFLQLRVEVDGASPNGFRQRFCDQWFRQLDQNKDGLLSKSEVAKFLTQFGEQLESAKPPTWETLNTDPADGKVTPKKFRAFVDRQLGPPVVLVNKKQAGEEGTSLFGHLDLNGDGALSEDELKTAAQTLAPLDADDDETISLTELKATPEKDAGDGRDEGSAGHRSGGSPPIVVIDSDAVAKSVALRLLRQYGAGDKNVRDRRLGATELGLSEDALRPFVQGSSPAGKLGLAELTRLVLAPPLQITLAFQLFEQRRGQPHVSVVRTSRAPAFELEQPAGDRATLVVNGLPIELTAKRTRASTGDMSRYYALRFNIVDRDKNNYLDKKEFPALGLPEADFAAVDANGDGQIVASELADFLKGKGAVPVNQILIAVSDESKSLFEFLDTRPDGRLSPRELQAAPLRLKELDRNKDGKVSWGELRTRIGVEVELKRPAGPRNGMMVRPMQNRQSTPVVPRDSGPEWFLRMDRNYDGDVSRREFLGSKQAFDRLDADHDGLISPDEAETAKK